MFELTKICQNLKHIAFITNEWSFMTSYIEDFKPKLILFLNEQHKVQKVTINWCHKEKNYKGIRMDMKIKLLSFVHSFL